MSDDPRLSAPSAVRNRDAILQVLRRYLPDKGAVLEVASGTGEHVACFAGHLTSIVFQPSELDPSRRASIDAWTAGMVNVLPAIPLDTTAAWPSRPVDAVVCCNMIHIAPWAATIGLVQGSARVLKPAGVLITYGPYFRADVETAPSNLDFDADLKARNPEWGIRDLDSVAEIAAKAGFGAPDIIEMPANNLCLVFHQKG